MLKLFSVLIISVYLYASSVLLIKCIKNVSTAEAKTIINNFFKDCFRPAPTIEVYPVFIGIDGNGLAHANIVEDIFHDLAKVFTSVVFSHYIRYANRLVYHFHVECPINEMDDRQLISYANSICDKTVHAFLHQVNPAYGYIPYLVIVDYRPGELVLSIATCKNGLEENYRYQCYKHLSETNASSECSSMTEKWEDN